MSYKNFLIDNWILIILVIIFSCIIVFVYQNRSAEILYSKIVPSLLVAMAAGFITLLFSLEGQQINYSIPSVLIAHAEKMTPIEELFLNYPKYYGGKLHSARVYLNPLIIEDKKQKLLDYHFDVLTVELLELLFDTYQSNKEYPNKIFYSSSQYPKYLEISHDNFTWDDFKKIFISDLQLANQLKSINHSGAEIYNMSVPKGTKFDFKSSDIKRTLIMGNKFVDLEISILVNGGQRNINDWKYILNINEEDTDKYWTSYFTIHLNAKYKRFKSGHPLMASQKEWLENIITRIKSEYDYNLQLDNATKYYHNFGHKINK